MTAATSRSIPPRVATTLLLAPLLQACGDGPTASDVDSLEPYSFAAMVSGGMTGVAEGRAIAGTGTVGDGHRMRVINLEGHFPDGEEHLIAIYFLSSNPSGGSYSVAPEWAPGDSLGSGEVAVSFGDVVGPRSATITHVGVSGTLQLEVGSVEHLSGGIDVEFTPAEWADPEGGDLRADVRFRLK